ncbi:MAG TPA: hypothetical protein VNJ02_05555 [Vicinamibacterales bacterium]|nr:hypothetical protein [Vicinamibacterales bacterium]
MTRLVASTLKTGVVTLLAVPVLISRPAAQQQSVTDRLVNSRMPITLDVPVHDAAGMALQLILAAAGVTFGIEHPPPAPPAPVDFARRPQRTVALAGMRLGDALDAIVREDPRYAWTEVDGRIIVRPSQHSTQRSLDTRLPSITVSRASMLEALTILSHAIDPARPRPTVGQMGMQFEIPGTGHAASGPAAARSISVALTNPTAFDVLEAMARSHGLLSWQVHYDAGDDSLAASSIALSTIGSIATAQSAAMRDLAAKMRGRLRIPVWRSLETMLSLYHQRTGVLMGLELPPDVEPSPIGGPPIDLTDLPPAVAVARLVALDSRFEWTDDGGMFSIAPRAEFVSRPTVLDRRLESVVMPGLAAEAALEVLVGAIGGKRVGGGYGEGGLPGRDSAEQARRRAASRARTVSLSLANVTVREVLNALCRAHGALSWRMRPPSARGREPYHFDLGSADGWSVGLSFSLNP